MVTDDITEIAHALIETYGKIRAVEYIHESLDRMDEVVNVLDAQHYVENLDEQDLKEAWEQLIDSGFTLESVGMLDGLYQKLAYQDLQLRIEFEIAKIINQEEERKTP